MLNTRDDLVKEHMEVEDQTKASLLDLPQDVIQYPTPASANQIMIMTQSKQCV